MKLVKNVFEKKIEVFFIGKKNNKYMMYDFFQALSLAVAYLKINEGLEYKGLRKRHLLWREYSWNALQKTLTKIPKEEMTTEEWKRKVYQQLFMMNEPIFKCLVKLMDEDEKVIQYFSKYLEIKKIREDNENKKVKVYVDRKIKYSIGVVTRR